MLVKGLLTAKRSITILALVHWIVSWGIVVLLESLNTAKPAIALVTLVERSVSWGV